MDIESLRLIAEKVSDVYRFRIYKRIADICLFILGIFPDYAEADYRYPLSGQPRPRLPGKPRMAPEEYEDDGRKFYRLGAQHRTMLAAA